MSLLNESVLVLNKYYMAVQVSIVKDAITVLVTGKAVAVDENYVPYSFKRWTEYTKENQHNGPVVDKYAGILHSPSVILFTPQVIKFPDCEYTSPLIKTVKYSRRNIYSRDKHACQYCLNKRSEFRDAVIMGATKKSLLNLDHVIPKARGGQSSWTNIVTACRWCNADKGDKLLEDIGWKLHKIPAKPQWQSHVGTPFQTVKKKYWERFLAQ